MKSRIQDLLLRVDCAADGVRVRLLVAAAVLEVFLAPLWDRYLPYHRIAANLEPMTFAATLLFLLLLVLLAGGRLVALTTGDGGDPGAGEVRPSLRRVLQVASRLARGYSTLLRREPPFELLARVGAGLGVALLAVRGGVALLRWSLWKGLNAIERWSDSPVLVAWLRPGLEWVYRREANVLALVVYLSLPTALAAAVVFLRRPRRAVGGGPLALQQLPQVLERSDPHAPAEVLAAYGGATGELCQRVLRALNQWRPDRRVKDEDGCRDDLVFFLCRCGFQVAAERWIRSSTEGRRRVDLVIEDQVAIELKYDLHNKGAAERDRVFGQVQTYAHIWGAQGPVLLFLARTPRASAGRIGEASSHFNAALKPAVAPILVLADS